MEYTKTQQAGLFQFRWFIENCCEFKLPDGKTLVIDPMLIKDASQARGVIGKNFVSRYCVNDLEGCDYVLITHTHGDHVESLKEVCEKFRPQVLVNALSAFALAKYYDIPFSLFQAAYDGCEYNLGSLRVKFIPGRHSLIPPTVEAPSKGEIGAEPGEINLNNLGSFYNSNFLLTLPNGIVIAFDGGRYEPDICEWEQYHPNIVFSHRSQDLEECTARYVDLMTRTGAQLLMPLCQQKTRDGIDNIVNLTNQRLAAAGAAGRAVNPESGKWYTLFMGITG